MKHEARCMHCHFSARAPSESVIRAEGENHSNTTGHWVSIGVDGVFRYEIVPAVEQESQLPSVETRVALLEKLILSPPSSRDQYLARQDERRALWRKRAAEGKA